MSVVNLSVSSHLSSSMSTLSVKPIKLMHANIQMTLNVLHASCLLINQAEKFPVYFLIEAGNLIISD